MALLTLHTMKMTELEHRIVTAGVICFAVAEATQSVFLLLGQEQNEQWCDFGGHLQEEEDALQGAAREFAEESLCVVQLDGEETGKNETERAEQYARLVQDQLQANKYFLRLEISSVEDESKLAFLPIRVYYLKRVHWQPDVAARFADLRQRLLLADDETLCNHPAINNDAWFEKVAVDWWSVDRLRQVMRNDGKYKEQRFRKSFLPVLNIILNKLSNV